jgi:glucose-6-phosphate 1-dehydrogenase
VLITFKPLPHLPTGLHGKAVLDRLRLSMQPDAMAIEINVNGPGDPLDLEPVVLSTDLNPGRLPPYGEVMAGVLDADPLLSVRGDTAEQCWRIVDPVLQAWRENRTPLDSYAAGSTGPAEW